MIFEYFFLAAASQRCFHILSRYTYIFLYNKPHSSIFSIMDSPYHTGWFNYYRQQYNQQSSMFVFGDALNIFHKAGVYCSVPLLLLNICGKLFWKKEVHHLHDISLHHFPSWNITGSQNPSSHITMTILHISHSKYHGCFCNGNKEAKHISSCDVVQCSAIIIRSIFSKIPTKNTP